MEDAEGGLSFDFEGGLDGSAVGGPVYRSAADVDSALDNAATHGPDAAAAAAAGSLDPGAGPGGGHHPPGGRRSFRQTVCRHWLRGLCMKGDACGFLHQYDKDRMPVCRFFRLYGECREQDCPYKHTTEDIKECNMYVAGLCAFDNLSLVTVLVCVRRELFLNRGRSSNSTCEILSGNFLVLYLRSLELCEHLYIAKVNFLSLEFC